MQLEGRKKVDNKVGVWEQGDQKRTDNLGGSEEKEMIQVKPRRQQTVRGGNNKVNTGDKVGLQNACGVYTEVDEKFTHISVPQ